MNKVSTDFLTEVAPEKSQYQIVYVDLSHRCNMECANCYLPNRDFPDIDTERLLDTISRFKVRTEFRFIGGEPTLHKDLFRIIETVVNMPLRHRVTLVTNGLRLAHLDFVQRLKDAGLTTVYLSLNGADDDIVYQVTDGIACADKKIAALDNIAKVGLKLAIGCILVKNINEHVPLRIKELLEERGIYASIEFRNIGDVGRSMDNENYTFIDVLSIVTEVYGVDIRSDEFWNNLIEYDQYSMYFAVEPSKAKLLKTNSIRISSWDKMRDGFSEETNEKRGRLTQNFKVAQYFEHLKQNNGGY